MFHNISLVRSVLLAGVVVTSHASYAFAKDMVMADGPYMGVFAGYAIGKVDNDEIGFGSSNANMDGSTAGMLFGYDWHVGQYLFGVEGSIAVHEIKGSSSGAGVSSKSTDHLMSVHGGVRAGYSIGSFTPYLGGGLAYGSVHNHRIVLSADGEIDDAVGYYGKLGLETPLWRNVKTRLEYVYENVPGLKYNLTDIGRRVESDLQTHMFRAGLTIHTNTPEQSSSLNAQYNPTAFSGDWGGFYAGFQIAGAIGKADIRQKNGLLAGGKDEMSLSGLSGGSVLGYNFQRGKYVVGLEGDLSISNYEGKLTSTKVISQEADIFWLANVKARVGYDMGRILPFVSAGYALGQSKNGAIGTLGNGPDPLKFGVSVGTGVEYRLTDKLNIRAGYDYIHFQKIGIAPANRSVDFQPSLHQGKLGLTWRFD